MSEKQTILEHLQKNHVGLERAEYGNKLCRDLGISGRVLRGSISELRADGHPICSDTTGYFYAGTMEEIDNTISHLANRALEMDKAREGLENSKINFVPGDAGGENGA